MAGVENELGREARPFSLELIVLPVQDDEIRAIHPHRYLVPERRSTAVPNGLTYCGRW
ncbi:hypothetical protein [Acrocarpospora catenulata]|uniref:hypothetical protein n=1 Tax=Acrocarpospora catenulata TaxID=2836182 RepID=UPI001BDAF245|nr:hypothetical protein [Acrocarpospora catenulata]